MKVTIRDIADKAGVSIATVSHVINGTRYVNPNLVDKIKKIIKEYDYKKNTEYKIRVGKRSEIALLVPCFENYVLLADILSRDFSQAGFSLSVSITHDDINIEKSLLTTLLNNKSISGIILVPAAHNIEQYEMILNRTTPFIMVNRCFDDDTIDSVTTDYESAVYKSATYLAQCGHEKIALITEKKEFSTAVEQVSGYRRALTVHNITYHPDLVLAVNSYQEDAIKQSIYKLYQREKPTAFISGIGWITPKLLQFLEAQGLECPKHISFIGIGNKGWDELIDPPITAMEDDYGTMGAVIAAKMLDKIAGSAGPAIKQTIKANFLLRKSTRMIGRGPFGEEAIPIDDLTLSEEEIEYLRQEHFKVGISFHYDNNAWTRLHENGIRDTLEKYDIRILSVTNAQFNPELQVTQLEGIRMQKPDAIIAIPSDDIKTAAKFKELAGETKLIFMSSVPTGIKADEYASCVSVNERENGYNAGVLMGEYFKNRNNARVGFLKHGTSFYGTHLRDGIAAQVIQEDYPSIKIVSEENFYRIERAYEVCKAMITGHPDIEGLYISWERPALLAIKALKELGREDIAVFTFDLDQEIALYFARGDMVKGLVTQRPYTQGTAVALATLKALLGEEGYKYIGVSPYVVQRNKLLKAWKDIFQTHAPNELENAVIYEFT